MPSYPPKFQPGDTVTIRAWDDMFSQYGSVRDVMFSQYGSPDGLGIKTPYIVFSSGMKQYCGRSFKVKHIRPSINDEHWIYTLDDAPLSLLLKTCSFLPHLLLLLPFPSMIF